MLTPREKSPLPGKFFSKEDRTHNAASSRTVSPTHYQRAIPAPSEFKSNKCMNIEQTLGMALQICSNTL